jgi:Matrixin
MRHRTVGTIKRVIASLLLLGVVAVGSPPAIAATAQPRSIRPGDRFTAEGITLIVQQPGRGVWSAALEANGGWRAVGVSTALDGSVSVVEESAPSAPTGPTSDRTAPCSDNAYTLYSNTWDSTYAWYFNASTAPSEISQHTATTGVRNGVENIVQVNNDCGLADNVSAKQHYKGTTSKMPNIFSGSSCDNSDGTNVVAFGNLASTDIAFTCWWTIGNTTVEADLKLNKVEYSWVVNIGSNCSAKYSVEAISTHEFGHAFGLGHVSEILHGTLTMSPVILPCQSSEKTLGLGDVRGLEAQY